MIRSLKTMVLASASAVSLATAAAAQTATPGAPDSVPSGPQQHPDSGLLGTAPSPAAVAQDDTIVVTGVRASLQRAQEIKRFAASNVEAITLEDLGKFSDTSISDALQRVPGVNVDRNDDGFGGGDGVTIRGLGPDFVNTTINGREQLGNVAFGGNFGRSFDVGSLPSEILSGVLIYKAPTAEIVESGLGGEIQFNTLRPLDYKIASGKSYFGSATFTSEIEDIKSRYSPRGSAIIGAKLLDGTLGIYVAGLAADEKRTDPQIRTVSIGLADVRVGTPASYTTYKNVIQYGSLSANISDRDNERRAISGGIQYKPTPKLDININGIYNRFREYLDNHYADTGNSLYASNVPGAVYPNVVIQGDTETFYDSRGVTVIDPAIYTLPPFNDYIQSGDRNYTQVNRLWTVGGNIAWKTSDDSTRVTLDYAHDDEKFSYTYEDRSYITKLATIPFKATIDTRNVDTPIVTFFGPGIGQSPNDFKPTSPGSFYIEGQNLAQRDQVRLDLAQRLGEAFTIKLGGRYVETSFDYRQAAGNINISQDNQPSFFTGKLLSFPGFTTPVLEFNRDAFCSFAPASCGASNVGRGSFAGDFPTTPAGKGGDVLAFDGSSSYAVKEKNAAIYGQIDGKGALFGLPTSGNIGVRGVHIEENAKAFQGTVYRYSFFGDTIDPGHPQTTALVDAKNDYWRVLPAGNLTLKPAPNINLRLGIAETIRLADYRDLAPRGTATIYTDCPATIVGCAAPGKIQPALFNGGNTNLKPTTSVNYDLTGEYYTSYGGSFILSGFYKDVSNQIVNVLQQNVTIPGQGATLFNATAPFNAPSGKTYGAEFETNQPLRFLPDPFNGLGVLASYAYVYSKLDAYADNPSTPFPGASKHNINLTGYYERGGFSFRAAYNYRSSYLLSIGTQGTSVYVKPQNRLDLTVSQRLFGHLEGIITATNVLGEHRAQYLQEANFPAGFVELPTVYSIGVRASF